MRRYHILGWVLLTSLCIGYTWAAGESKDSRAIRTLLEQEASGWRRPNVGTIVSRYTSAFVGYEGYRASKATQWKIVFNDKKEFRAYLDKRLSRVRYGFKRSILSIQVGGTNTHAFAVTHDVGAATFQESGLQEEVDAHTFWILTKDGEDWGITHAVRRLPWPEE